MTGNLVPSDLHYRLVKYFVEPGAAAMKEDRWPISALLTKQGSRRAQRSRYERRLAAYICPIDQTW